MENLYKRKKVTLKPFLSAEKIQLVCKDLADQINQDYVKYTVSGPELYTNPKIVGLCILKGGLFFVSDILRHIKIPIVIDFVKLSSYGKDFRSSGTVTILQDISVDIRNKHIIVFDEIIDSGRTLSFYVDRLKAAEPKSIRICTLIDKKACRHPESNIEPDYIGITAGDEFLVGYGLDHAEQFRNLPDIHQLIS